jgi:hypothetical protein
MKTMTRTLTAAVLLCVAASLHAGENVLWKTGMGRPGIHHEPVAISLLSDGTIVAAGIVGADGQDAASAIWLLDGSGAPKKEIALLPGHDDSAVRDVRTGRGAIVVLLTTNDGPYLTAVDRDGNELYTRKVGDSDDWPQIMIPSGDGFVLAGQTGRHTGRDALLIAVGADGLVQWKRTYDRGRIEVFTDGFATAEGLVIAGQSGDYRPTFAGNAWLVVINGRGDVLRERQWNGRDLRVAKIDEERFAAVYDRAFEFRQDVAVSMMKSDLTPAWTTPIQRTDTYRGTFYIAATSGSIEVAGSGSIDAKLWRLDGEGRVVSSWAETPSDTRPWHMRANGILTAGGTTYVLTTIYESKPDGMPAWRVGVIKTE